MQRIIGINPVIEVLSNKEKNIEKIEIFKGSKNDAINTIKQLASKRNIKIFYTNKKIENSQGVSIFITDYDYYKDMNEFLEKIAPKKESLLLILDGIQDPRNLGAIIRAAECLGVEGIFIPERHSVKITETVIKTSAGAIEYTNIIKVTNLSVLIEKLKKLEYWIYGAAGEAEISYLDEKYPDKTVLVLGNEGMGLRKTVREHCDKLIKIPMSGKINSLNVSVAGGIILSKMSAR